MQKLKQQVRTFWQMVREDEAGLRGDIFLFLIFLTLSLMSLPRLWQWYSSYEDLRGVMKMLKDVLLAMGSVYCYGRLVSAMHDIDAIDEDEQRVMETKASELPGEVKVRHPFVLSVRRQLERLSDGIALVLLLVGSAIVLVPVTLYVLYASLRYGALPLTLGLGLSLLQEIRIRGQMANIIDGAVRKGGGK